MNEELDPALKNLITPRGRFTRHHDPGNEVGEVSEVFKSQDGDDDDGEHGQEEDSAMEKELAEMEDKFFKCCRVEPNDVDLIGRMKPEDGPTMMENYQRIMSYFQNKNVFSDRKLAMEQIEQVLSGPRDNSSFAELASYYAPKKGEKKDQRKSVDDPEMSADMQAAKKIKDKKADERRRAVNIQKRLSADMSEATAASKPDETPIYQLPHERASVTSSSNLRDFPPRRKSMTAKKNQDHGHSEGQPSQEPNTLRNAAMNSATSTTGRASPNPVSQVKDNQPGKRESAVGPKFARTRQASVYIPASFGRILSKARRSIENQPHAEEPEEKTKEKIQRKKSVMLPGLTAVTENSTEDQKAFQGKVIRRMSVADFNKSQARQGLPNLSQAMMSGSARSSLASAIDEDSESDSDSS